MPILSFNGYGYLGNQTKFMQLQYFLNTDIYNLLENTSRNTQIFRYQNAPNTATFDLPPQASIIAFICS